jgi:site-specific DNA-cytosine methylase
MKTCTQCNCEKPLTAFGKMSSSKDKLHCWCKECVNIENKEWRSANKEWIHEYNISEKRRTYCKEFQKRKRIEKPEYNKDQQRKSYAKHKEKRYSEQVIWRLNNPAKVRFYNASRDKVRRKATPKWVTKDHKTFMEIQYQMAKLLSERLGFEHHVDHIHPIQGENVCGLHVPWNLRVIPAAENIRKGNKIVQETYYV